MPSPNLAVLCVYRRKNARTVERLIAEPPDEIRLWALDEIDPALAPWTVGCGPGLRVPLLNRLHSSLPCQFDGFVVLADDDVELSNGLRTVAAVARRLGFGLSQPAHSLESHVSHDLTKRVPFALARETNFVECGPLVLVSPTWRADVLPMPEEFGMGPGLDGLWPAMRSRGCAFGVIDALPLVHLEPPGHAYDMAEGNKRYLELRATWEGGPELRTIATYRAWGCLPATPEVE